MKNISKNCIRLLIVLFLISHFSFLISKAEASALSLSLEPSIITINAISPSNATANLKIQNKSDKEVNLQIRFKPFKPYLENGEVEYLDSKDFLMAQNIQILDNEEPVDNITLGPLQQKNLTLNINIPKDTTVSDYYFSIIFISQTNNSPTSTSSSHQIGIAANVLLSVGPKEIAAGEIEEFSSSPFLENGPVDFTIRIKNNGIHFIQPQGEITIKNMFGQIIGRIDLDSVNILSDSIRKIPNTLWKEDFLLGLYTATLTTSLGVNGPVFSRSIHFFSFPFQFLIILIIIAILVVIIRNRLKAYKT